MAQTKAKATPKATAVSTVVKDVPLPANYDESREARKAAFKQKIAAGSADMTKIAVSQDKKFNVPVDGEIVKSDEISGIIIDFTAHKNWFEGAYVKGESAPPNCFAIGDEDFDSLIPSSNSPDIQAQSCGTCALGKFEKDAKGKWLAPACKSKFRLAVVAPGQEKLMLLDISSTGTKEFIKYINSIYAQGKDFNEVITEFTFDAGSDYPSVRCRDIGDVPAKHKGFLASLEVDARAMVLREPNVDEFDEKVAAKRLPAPKKRRAA